VFIAVTVFVVGGVVFEVGCDLVIFGFVGGVV
jgi:hypothetical protein